MKTKTQPCPKDVSVDDLARMAQVLKLLAHPHRLKIIDLLESEGDAPVHQLMARLELPQSATSGHLNLMRRIGLVDGARRGKEVWYSIGDRRSLAILNCMRSKKGT
jgi:ArsR family transcriptional regulator, zinc-responsive transcriptional repressor